MARGEAATRGRVPVLTRAGRVALERKAEHLETDVIPALKARAREGEAGLASDHASAVIELAKVRGLLCEAVDAEDLPADPTLVELGDTVSLAMPDGGVERYIIVHPEEAPVDRQRISCESPLSKAILGRHVGEKVTVAAPAGSFEVSILCADREVDGADPMTRA